MVLERRVLVTSNTMRPDDEADLYLRAAGIRTEFNYSRGGRTEEDMISMLQGIDGVIAGLDPFTARVLGAVDRLKVICRTGVGYDTVDVEAASQNGIVICITPGTNRLSVAEYAFALLLQCSRKMTENFSQVRGGSWAKHTGKDLAGATLGIVGLGAIGKTVAVRARAFEMRVLANDIVHNDEFARLHDITYVSLDELLRDSDFVSLHLYLDVRSYHLINAKRLALMKPTAYLINTSRGGVLDTDALCKALGERRIAGAALDVFEQEPLEPESPLRELDNAYLSPHAAAWTVDFQRASK